MARKLVIAAVCARPYVAMARAAGYDVIALDIFADADTQVLASKVIRLPYANGGFEPTSFEAVLSELNVQHDICGFLYGSGFEANPALLNSAASHMPLVGNSADVVAAAKAVPGFFNLLAELDIPYPPTSLEAPEVLSGWLVKRAGGSGGTHIRRMCDAVNMVDGDYYQRELIGVSVSILFVADGINATAIGYNSQSVAACLDQPFRYGGLVSNAELPDACRESLYIAAHKLTRALRLRGLNSLDAILTLDGQTSILELNPRLTASAGLYDNAESLMQVHLEASQGKKIAIDINQTAQAQAIFYAEQAFIVPHDIDWPAWVADLPMPGDYIAAEDPVCTVYAKADTANAAWSLVESRLRMVSALQYGKSIART